ncbi:hypothetical protein ACVWXO_000709 [Bradyrhizobium sp. LM2.7]
MAAEISDDDHVSRCIVYNKFFRDDIHTDELLWQFGQSDSSGAAHESGVLRSLAPSLDEVHGIGCKIVAIQNERLQNPAPGDKKRRYYCGCRTARAGDLPKEEEGFTLALSLVEEHGLKAHVDFALTVKGDTKSARAVNRTNAGLALAECFGETEAHVCDCDRDDMMHPIARFGPECVIVRRHGSLSLP